MLALHLLLKKPSLFHRFIATSPAVVDQGVAQFDGDSLPERGSTVAARVFLSVGSADDEHRPHIESFVSELRGQTYRSLDLSFAVIPGLGHIAAAPTGFLMGLAAIYAPSA